MSSASDHSDESKRVNALLERVRQADSGARNELVRLLYVAFRRRAHDLLRQERPGHTLATADLMDEGLARLLQSDMLAKATDRAELYRAFAGAMKRVLVDHARRRGAEKRGGGRPRQELDDFVEAVVASSRAELLKLDGALRDLSLEHPRVGEVLELRFFAGLTMPEIAELQGMGLRTVEGDSRFGLAWLRDSLTTYAEETAP